MRSTLLNAVASALLLLAVYQTHAVAVRFYGQSVAITRSSGEFTLLIAFTAADCSSFAPFVMDWRALADLEGVEIVGVPLDDARSLERAEIDLSVFPHQIRRDFRRGARHLIKRLGATTTPVAILVDSGGRPRMLLSPRHASQPQRYIAGLVKSYITSNRQ